MRILHLLILIIFSFFVFGCSNSDSNQKAVEKKEEVTEKYPNDDKKIISGYDKEYLKTIDGIKNYLQGGWSSSKKDNTLYYFFDDDNVIHYIVVSQEYVERLKDDNDFIQKSKQFSKARESKVIYEENGTITFVPNENDKNTVSIEIIDENRFAMDLGKDKPIFKRNSVEKPIVGEIYQKLD